MVTVSRSNPVHSLTGYPTSSAIRAARFAKSADRSGGLAELLVEIARLPTDTLNHSQPR